MSNPFLLSAQISSCKDNINRLKRLYKIEFNINNKLPIDYAECGHLRKLIRKERVKFKLLKKQLSIILQFHY